GVVVPVRQLGGRSPRAKSVNTIPADEGGERTCAARSAGRPFPPWFATRQSGSATPRRWSTAIVGSASPNSRTSSTVPLVPSSRAASRRATAPPCGRRTPSRGSSPRSGGRRRAGGSAPATPPSLGPEAAYVLGRSRAHTLFTVRGFLDTDYPALLADADVELPALEHIVLMSGDADDGSVAWKEFLAQRDGARDADVDARIASLEPDD